MDKLMLTFIFIIPLITIIVGTSMKKGIPKKVNNIWGYRTIMSMKNEETWKFAQNYCGKLWLKLGIITTIVSIIAVSILINLSEDIFEKVTSILIIVQTIVLVISVFVVEKALKNNFDEYGNKK